MDYIGNGPKLAAKVRQYGINNMRLEVLFSDPDYEVIKKRLQSILNPATLADPRCLNMPLPEKNAKIAEALTDLPKSDEHKERIALAMVGNDNAAIKEPSSPSLEAPVSESSSTLPNNNLRWVHNKENGEELQLLEDEDLLTGFEEGRLPKELKSKFNRNKKKTLTDAERALLSRD